MKENSLDSHRGKVAENKAIAAVAIRSESTTSTNFDDDYNEWELGIGDLIIDLDADIEKNNEKQQLGGNNNNTHTSTNSNATATSSSIASAALSSPTSPASIGLTVSNTNNCSSPTSPNGNCADNAVINSSTNNNSNSNHHYHHHHHQAALQQANFVVMSSGKNKLNNNNNTNGSGGGGGGGPGGNGGNGSGAGNSGGSGNNNSNLGGSNVEHQATVDKGLKMKIKRTKPTKTSEAKHEIVKSDTKPNSPIDAMNVGNGGSGGSGGAGGNGSGNTAGSSGVGSNSGNSNNSGSGGLLGGGGGSSQTAISGGLASSESGNSAGSGSGSGGGKSKHASSKGRGGSHREKKERARDKDRGDKERGTGGKSVPSSGNVNSVDVNGAHANSGGGSGGGSTACSINTSAIKLSNATINVASLPTPTVNLGIPANVSQLGLTSGNGSTVGGVGSGTTTNATGNANNGSNVNGNASSCGNGTSSSSNLTSASSASNFSNGCGSGTGASAGQGSSSNCGGAVNGASSGGCAGGGGGNGNVGPNGSGPCNGGNGNSNGGGGGGSVGTSSGTTNSTVSANGAAAASLSVKLEPKYPNVPISTFATIKLEDNLRGIPNKRMRMTVEKSPDKPQQDQCMSPKAPEMHDICVGTSVGTITEPECLGPCEPGTTVTLEGIVWQETEGGVLVVNVTWRGKTYVGTLLDCTKHDWAPPRFCESPTSDVESRTPKGRGKRGRGGAAAAAANVDPINFTTETRSASKLRSANKGRRTNNSGFTAPPSPAKSTEGIPLVGMKRKGRPVELELSQAADVKSTKRSRSQSRGTPTNNTPPADQPSSPVLIECPEPNCSKKYKHINGLRYHQTHAHHSNNPHPSGTNEDSPDEPLKDASSENDESTQESVPQSPGGGVGGGSSSDRNQRSSPRPFTGKVPQPPSCTATADFKPAVPIASTPNSTNNSSNSSTSSSPSPSLPSVNEVNGDSSSTNTSTFSSCAPSSFSNCATDLSSVDTKANVAPVVGGSVKAGVEATCVSVPPSTSNSDASNNILWYGQSNSASPIGSQSQADITNNKVASPSFSSSMSVITSTSATRVTSPVAAAAAPLSLSPSPHQSPRHLASVAIQQQQLQQQQQQQQPLGLAAQIYHHHQFAHPSAGPIGAEGSSVPLGISLPPSVVGGSVRPPSANMAGLASHPLSPSIAGIAGGPPSPHNLIDKSKIKQEKTDKYKMKIMTPSPSSVPRPMTPPSAAIPSPSSMKQSQMLSSSPPPMMNLNALQPMSSKSVMPSSMKPLHSAKPGTDPLLDGAKRERSKHRKRSRDREREQRKSGGSSSGGPPYNMHLHGMDLGSGHHSSVTETDKINGNMYSKVSDLIGKDRLSGASPDMPLDLNTSSADNASTCNENVQSPAYSDISDANDSTPAPENDAPTIKDNKEDKNKMSPEQNTTPAHNLSPYGVHYYYSQPSYVVPPLTTQSPPTPRSSSAIGADRNIKEEVITLDKPEEKHTKDSNKHWNEQRSRSSSGNHDRGISAAESQERMMHNSNQMNPMAAHMQAAHEYQMQQQKQLLQQQQQQQQHQYAYAYGHGYGFHYVDQPYQVHMKQEPYKHHQQYTMEEKERMYTTPMGYGKDVHHDRMKEMSLNNNKDKGQNLTKDSVGKNPNENLGENSRLSGRRSSELSKQINAPTSASSTHNISNPVKERDSHMHHSQRSSSSSHQSSHHMDRMANVGNAMPPGSRVEALSASLKEKQHDNHGNMKENMQMDKKVSYEQMLYHHSAGPRQDYVRYMLYQDQKSAEEQARKEEMAAASASSSGNKHHYDNKSQISSKEQPASKTASSVSHPSTSSHSSSSSSSSRGSSSSPKVSLGIGGSKDNASGKDSLGSKKDGERGDKSNVGDSSLSSESGTKDKKESDQRAKSQEGQKPTMETQGPPPPTNSYAYMHPAYMQSPHYNPMAFDPSMYRPMNPMIMTAAHYPGAPYLHPQLPVRYHVPQQAVEPQQDLSPKMHHQTKALDLLQHHASQYYSSHKIHELQDHAIKPPGPGSGNGPVVNSGVQPPMNSSKLEPSAKTDPLVNPLVNSHDRTARSPPLQRHLHTHHHTHVGVGYPIYDPYGAVIVSGQQEANTKRCCVDHPATAFHKL